MTAGNFWTFVNYFDYSSSAKDGWDHIKRILILTNIYDTVQFFMRLISERSKSDEEGPKVQPHCMTPATGLTSVTVFFNILLCSN